MRKEHIYSKLICGALLLFGICVPVCAQTGHLSGVRVINDEIKKKGREIHVDFVLDVTDMHVKRQESVAGTSRRHDWHHSAKCSYFGKI